MNKKLRRFWFISLLGTLAASFYPIYMGVRVVTDMIRNGTVMAGDYPKYIIPYTPISIAVIIGVLLIPLALKYCKRFALAAASGVSVGVFFAAELILERWVIVTTTVTETVLTKLESWQMYMCYASPATYETRTWTEVDVLMGEYSPAFKLHFYLISVLLIVSLLNCFYGFAHMIGSGDRKRLRALIIQSVSSLIFLGLCILACFTAFFRTGEIQVSALSAVLMCLFFVVFGVTAAIYVGSFLLGRHRLLSVGVPAVTSAVVTLVMYIGEMILLSGNLYRFGEGFFFSGLGGIVLAPVDILVIIASGGIGALIMVLIEGRPSRTDRGQTVADG